MLHLRLLRLSLVFLSLRHALYALAAEGFDVMLEKVVAIIIGDLFARKNIFERHDEDSAFADDRLSVRPARMICIARRIVAGATIDIKPAIHGEDIAVLIELVSVFGGDPTANVLDNSFAFLDGSGGKKPEAGTRALHGDIGRTDMLSRRHKG